MCVAGPAMLCLVPAILSAIELLRQENVLSLVAFGVTPLMLCRSGQGHNSSRGRQAPHSGPDSGGGCVYLGTQGCHTQEGAARRCAPYLALLQVAVP